MLELFKKNPPEDKVFSIEGTEARHIPINHLEDMLDVINYSTSDFQYQIFKDQYSNLCVAASLVLHIKYEEIGIANRYPFVRTFVGACNFPLSSIEPNQHFLATAKSECIKNAASDIGKYFGRGLNDGIVPSYNKKTERKESKLFADKAIMKKYNDAIESGDQATITLLNNMYEIQPDA